jgi:hypothetical protein
MLKLPDRDANGLVLMLLLLLLAGCSGGSSGIASAPVVAATPDPTQSPGSSGGSVVIAIPTSAPLVCLPAAVTVPVAQTVIVSCTSSGYAGSFTFNLSDPTVASVELATGTLNFFYITGLKAGTTNLSLQFSATGSGSVAIAVR